MSSTPPAKHSKRKHLSKAFRRGVDRVKSAIQPSSLLAAPAAGSTSGLSGRSESVSPAPSIAPSVSPGTQPAAAEEASINSHDQSLAPSANVTSPTSEAARGTSAASPGASNTGRRAARKDAAWLGLNTALRGVGKTTQVFPPLGLAVNQLIGWLDVVQAAAANTEDYERLATELTGMLGTLDQYVTELGSEDPSGSAERIALSIKTEADEVGRKQDRGQGRRLLESTRDKEDVVKRYRRIKGLFRQLQGEISLQALRKANKQHVMTLLKGLYPIDDAVYNSSDSVSKRHGCSPQTREKLQQDLRDWVHDPNGAKVYWMNGMAGTGKTTIAYSLCEWLKSNRQLGASFFCSRASPSCRDFRRIVPTIAYQLAKYSPGFQDALCKALDQDVDAGKLDARGQFETLLRDPMNANSVTMPDGVVIVIDALDECEDDYGVRLILGVLLQHVATLPIRFFVTSRPEPAIRDPMSSGSGYSPTVLHLHDIEQSIVEEDIRKYLTDALSSMSPPPTADQIELLTKRAGKLFIYAATAVRYILPRKASTNPIERLNRALTASPQHTGQGQSSKRYKELDELYATILIVALDEEDEVLEEEERNAIRLVLRTVVCAREPMSIQTLATYLHLPETQVVFALESLRSVLHVSESGRLVSTLHASFPDYLHDYSRSKSFYCDPRDQNTHLVHRCFELMKEQLRFNMCNLESSFVFDKDVPNLEARVKSKISRALFYACLYWGDHLILSSVSDVLLAKLNEFLDRLLLFWMEVLNLERRITAGVFLLARAEKWLRVGQMHALRSLTLIIIQDTNTSTSTYEHTADARDFVSRFSATACNRSTPHLYVSALSFCAKDNFVYVRYWGRTKGLLGVHGTTMRYRNMSAQATWLADSRVTSVAFSPDGSCIVSGTDSGAVQVWDSYSGGTVVGPLRKHTDGVSAVAFCPEGRCVASGSWDHTMLLWDTSTGEVITGPYASHTDMISSIAFSADGTRIVSGSGDDTLLIWDARTCDIVSGPLRGHTLTVRAVAFSPDGGRVVSGSDDRTIRVWDARTGDTVAGPFKGHRRQIYSVGYSPDGTKVVSGSGDCTILLWDAETGDVVAGPLTGHTDQVFSVAFSPDGTRIASGSIDTTIIIWAADSGEMTAGPYTGHTLAIYSLMFSPDATRLVSGSFDSTIRVWAVDKGATDSYLQRHSSSFKITSIAFSPNNNHIASGSSNCTILVWDAHTGDAIAGPFRHHTGEVSSVAFSPDGARIASGSYDETVLVWDARTGKIIAGPFSHPGQVMSIAFSPDGARLVSGSDEPSLRVWDAFTGDMIVARLQGHTRSIGCVAFSPDGSHIASGSHEPVVVLWSALADYDAPKRFSGHTEGVTSVAFSPDGHYIASGSWDHTVNVWDTHSDSTPVNTFNGHTAAISSVAFSPSGLQVASGSDDGAVLVWDAYTGDIVANPLVPHERLFARPVFSPDGSRIASADINGIVRSWSTHANSAALKHPSGTAAWDNSTAPHSDTASATSTVIGTQVCHPPPTTPPTVESELPQQQDICTISQVIMRSTPNDNGWLMLDGAPVIWVPLELHVYLPYLHSALTIGSQGSMYFTDESLSLGESWRDCYVSQ